MSQIEEKPVNLYSEEGEVLYYTDISPRLMIGVDQKEPGIANKAFSLIGDDAILIHFRDSCNALGMSFSNGPSGVKIFRGGESSAQGESWAALVDALYHKVSSEISAEECSIIEP